MPDSDGLPAVFDDPPPASWSIGAPGTIPDHDSSTPPLWQDTAPLGSFPGSGTHGGWDATTVSTAKCDMCHKQRCGTIQQCSQCKLSVCLDCAIADRLRGDPRHALDPAQVDWSVPPALLKLRQLRASRATRAGRQGTARALLRLQHPARGRESEARPASLRAISASSSSPASPPTDLVSTAFDDDERADTDVDDDAAADECPHPWNHGQDQYLQPVDMPFAAAAALRGPPSGSATRAASHTSVRTAQTEDAAEILAQMPCPRPWTAAEQQRNPHLYGSVHNIFLPPVRPISDPRQPGLLPPLRTLRLQIGVEEPQVQSSMRRGRSLSSPHPAFSGTHMGHWGLAQDSQLDHDGASSYAYPGAQGHPSWEAQQPQPQTHAYQSPSSAAIHLNEIKELDSHSALPAAFPAYPPIREPLMDPQSVDCRESFSGYTYEARLPPVYNGVSQSHGLADDCSSAEHIPTMTRAASPTESHQRSPPAAGPPLLSPRATIHDQAVALKFCTLAIQTAEHPKWSLDSCLQLALTRTWVQRVEALPRFDDRLRTLEELRAAAYTAAEDLGLPKQHSAVRTWIRSKLHSF